MRGESRLIAGRFRLERRIEQDPEIWSARDELLGIACEVEIASLASRTGWNGFERFERTARALSSKDLPRSLSAAMAFERDDDGDAFLVRESLVRERRNITTVGDVRALLRGLLEAVASLHAHDVRHGAIDVDRIRFRGEVAVLVGFNGPADDFIEPTCADDLIAIADTVRAMARIPAELESFVDDLARGRIPSAAVALARLDRCRPRDRRFVLLASFAAACLVATFAFVVHARARVPVAFAAERAALSNDTCALSTSPSGASVYALDGRTFSDEDPPVDARLGTTPLVVARPASGSRTLLVMRAGHRSLVVTVSAGTSGSCSLRLSLTPR